jgi:hypothetical protein
MKNINEIKKLLWDGESEDWQETPVKIFFKDGKNMIGEITENDGFQPNDESEFWLIEELMKHAKGFEILQ